MSMALNHRDFLEKVYHEYLTNSVLNERYSTITTDITTDHISTVDDCQNDFIINGQEVDVSLPDESKIMKNKDCPEESLYSVVAHGNALYLNIRYYRWGRLGRGRWGRIDKVVITNTKGVVITHLRDHLELVGDSEQESLIYIKRDCVAIDELVNEILCTRIQDTGPTVVYNLYDHPVRDAIPVDRLVSESKGTKLKLIHSWQHESYTKMVKLSKGAITVSDVDGLATAQLPIEYFDPTVPYDPLFSDFKSEFLDKFEPLGVLGEGGFGCVFEARNRVDQWKYAVKRIPLRGSVQAVDSALKEVRTLAALKHDGIVCYNSSWIEKPPARWQKTADTKLLKKLGYDKTMSYSDDCVFIYIQMEVALLCTKSLHQWLYSTSHRDITQAKVWFKELVLAVQYLHQMNKIHRDLKPSNALFDAKGRVKICDLGLIAERELRNGSEIDITRTAIGTPMYMAPEQRYGRYSSKVDIYSLGLILAELCVCMTNYQAYEAFMMYQNGRSTSILKHLPAVDSFVSWLTNVKPTNRPNCDQILTHQFLA
ncbi:hypothetical protein PRIPAC_91895 [Pristionchus pacificus]|uniref:Protein kinase domain-containing protein n=1 Tax=Pristionchus pacificus TaxID=54126 RepID=A0A2A6CH39_PRIPA|nr:hypothetical protein PRIPAC_91895 [Pristionchus pacificus]|eukprot:PDM77522.1 protein kinase [Pristionchus pacificus]